MWRAQADKLSMRAVSIKIRKSCKFFIILSYRSTKYRVCQLFARHTNRNYCLKYSKELTIK